MHIPAQDTSTHTPAQYREMLHGNCNCIAGPNTKDTCQDETAQSLFHRPIATGVVHCTLPKPLLHSLVT